MSELKHTNEIAIEILRNEYGDYDWNTWHYDREYLMLVKAQENALQQANEANKEQSKALNKHIVSCRTSVNWFAEQMELKLRDNDHKGGWARCEHSWLLDRLKQEVGELEKALDQVDNQENVIKEAADVANFALMIADLAGRLYGS